MENVFVQFKTATTTTTTVIILYVAADGMHWD